VNIPAVIIGDRVAGKLPVKVIRIVTVIVFAALGALIPKAELATLPKHGGPILNRCNARLAGYAPFRRSVSHQ
jgi:hypothetical protein